MHLTSRPVASVLHHHLFGWALLTQVISPGSPGVAANEPPAKAVVREKMLEGTPFETDLIFRDSGREGPVVFVTGGMHGNEPAGAAAAEQICEWPLRCGVLICVPRTNVLALDARKRYTPDAVPIERNLNRNFVVDGAEVRTQGVLAEHLWNLVEQYQPDHVIDLHEGYDFGRSNPSSVGSSVIAARHQQAEVTARLLLEAVNAEIDEADRKFMLRGPPVAGSLTRAAIEARGHSAMILETTWKDQSVARRCRQHRIMVATLLHSLGMLDDVTVANQFVPAAEQHQLNIALLDDRGVSGNGIPALQKLWGTRDNVTIDRVSAADIRAGVLEQFDILCCSGGSGSGQSKSLQAAGREQVCAFVERGGDYLGICGGSYLACSGFSWGLGILDAKTKSNQWRRGRASLPIRLTAAGQSALGAAEAEYSVLYANGPVIEPDDRAELCDFTTLATFVSEVSDNGTPAGIMIGSPAIVQGTFGAGTVICVSPHPEQTPATYPLMNGLLERLATSEK